MRHHKQVRQKYFLELSPTLALTVIYIALGTDRLTHFIPLVCSVPNKNRKRISDIFEERRIRPVA